MQCIKQKLETTIRTFSTIFLYNAMDCHVTVINLVKIKVLASNIHNYILLKSTLLQNIQAETGYCNLLLTANITVSFMRLWLGLGHLIVLKNGISNTNLKVVSIRPEKCWSDANTRHCICLDDILCCYYLAYQHMSVMNFNRVPNRFAHVIRCLKHNQFHVFKRMYLFKPE